MYKIQLPTLAYCFGYAALPTFLRRKVPISDSQSPCFGGGLSYRLVRLTISSDVMGNNPALRQLTAF